MFDDRQFVVRLEPNQTFDSFEPKSTIMMVCNYCHQLKLDLIKSIMEICMVLEINDSVQLFTKGGKAHFSTVELRVNEFLKSD